MTPFSSREENRDIVCWLLCTWLDRSFQTASKILGDFLKCHYFGQEAKVYHYYYDLYVFVKKCALFLSILFHLYKYV